jgi:rhodanese-related sulfurtransferase
MKQNIRPQYLHVRLQARESLRIIDVRSPAEFASGHIPGAENIPLGDIQSAIPGVDPQETLVLVCQGGVRSEAACKKVRNSHQNLFNLAGGTAAWIAAGLKVEAGLGAPPRLK